MNRKSVAATINSVCSDQFIKATSDRPTEYSILPIFKRPYDGYTIGIDSDGYWCLENESRLWPVERQNAYCPMSLLIYTPVSEVISLIKDGLKQKRLPLKIAYTFPFDDFLVDLIRRGGFWRAKAIPQTMKSGSFYAVTTNKKWTGFTITSIV